MSSGVDPAALGQWMNDAKLALDLVRGAAGLIPKGHERQKIDTSLVQAEKALGRADAALAKQLGYQLCQCTFPPQIMRWREGERSYVCPNDGCGHRLQPAQRQVPAKSIPVAKRCPMCKGELKVVSENPDQHFGIFGVMVHGMECTCGHKTTRRFDPREGGYK